MHKELGTRLRWLDTVFQKLTCNTRIKNLSFRPKFLRQNKEKWVLIKSDHCFTKTKTMIWLNEGSLYLCLAIKFGPEVEILDPCIGLKSLNFTFLSLHLFNHMEGKITRKCDWLMRRAFFLNSGQKLLDPDWLRRFILSIRTKYQKYTGCPKKKYSGLIHNNF